MTTRPASACVLDAQPRPHSSLEPVSLDIELKYAWQPGIWAQLPWQGLGSLFLVVLRQFFPFSSIRFRIGNPDLQIERFINHELERIVTGASAGIIALSHDTLIDRWRVGRIEIQPQVWLAVFSTIINALLAFSLTLGVSINFWKRAGRGTTVSQIFLSNFSCKLF